MRAETAQNPNSNEVWDSISSTRMKSSMESKTHYEYLRDKGLIFKHQHDWARLCIAYSMYTTLDANTELEYAPDANGIEIVSVTQLFQQEARLWVALIAHELYLKYNMNNSVNFDQSPNATTSLTKEIIIKRIHAHWHRGTFLLRQRFDELDVAYNGAYEARNKLLEELALATHSRKDATKNSSRHHEKTLIEINTQEQFTALQQACEAAEIIGVIWRAEETQIGLRKTRYIVSFVHPVQAVGFPKKRQNLAVALGIQIEGIVIGSVIGRANTCYIELLRPEKEWQILEKKAFQEALQNKPENLILPVCIGAAFTGKPIYKDLAKAPHLLIAGTTGSGKSVCLHSIIKSLLYRSNENNLQLALLDPKRIELAVYNGHAQLWGGQTYVEINEMQDTLISLCDEMENRYQLLAQNGVQDIQQLTEAQRPFRIVVVVEELADLIMQTNDAENLLIRLAQKSRAAGIHLVLVTQRPDAATFKGLLRTNTPARIALKVQNAAASRIILDEAGAEELIGKGDRIVMWGDGEKLTLNGFNL